jgi:hypothetical protein
VRALASRMVAAAAAAAAAVAARKAVEVGWHATRGEEPPTSGGLSTDTDLRDLLIWSAVLAAAVVLARRLATSATDSLLGVNDD